MDPETRRKIDYLPTSPTPHSHVERGRKEYRAGCRCEVCKAAWAAYHRNRRARQREALPAPDIAYTTLARVREFAEELNTLHPWGAELLAILDGGD